MRSECPRRRSVGGRRKALLALSATVLSVAAAEGFLRWRDVADPPAFEAHLDYGYLMRPDQSTSTRGHRFSINHAGLRDADFLSPKPNSVVRIVFVGDSITYGGGSIPDNDLFVNRTAFSLGSLGSRKIEAVNLGVPGWGIQNMAGYVMAKGLHEADLHEADLFVWVISSADFRRPQTSLEENHFLTKKPWSRLVCATSMLLVKAPQLFVKGIETGGSRETLKQNVEVFRHTLATATQRGTPSVVVVVPAEWGYGRLLDDLAQFRSAAESLPVPFMELGPAFQQHQLGKLFTDGVHLSARGHEVVADALVAFLRDDFLYGKNRTISRRPSVPRDW